MSRTLISCRCNTHYLLLDPISDLCHCLREDIMSSCLSALHFFVNCNFGQYALPVHWSLYFLIYFMYIHDISWVSTKSIGVLWQQGILSNQLWFKEWEDRSNSLDRTLFCYQGTSLEGSWYCNISTFTLVFQWGHFHCFLYFFMFNIFNSWNAFSRNRERYAFTVSGK